MINVTTIAAHAHAHMRAQIRSSRRRCTEPTVDDLRSVIAGQHRVDGDD
jgi:hypothetical protein